MIRNTPCIAHRARHHHTLLTAYAEVARKGLVLASDPRSIFYESDAFERPRFVPYPLSFVLKRDTHFAYPYFNIMQLQFTFVNGEKPYTNALDWVCLVLDLEFTYLRGDEPSARHAAYARSPNIRTDEQFRFQEYVEATWGVDAFDGVDFAALSIEANFSSFFSDVSARGDSGR